MEPDCKQQMAFLSTLKPVANLYNYIAAYEPLKSKTSSLLSLKVDLCVTGSQSKDRADCVRRSFDYIRSNSFDNFGVKTLKQSHGAFTEFTFIVQERQRCLNLAAEVSDLGDEASPLFDHHESTR